MRILCATLLLAACGPKHAGAPAKDFTLHDKLLVRIGDATATAIQVVDPQDGAVTPVYEAQGEPVFGATFAGRCVVFAHGDGLLTVVDPVTAKTWNLDEGNAGTSVKASADGLRVAWDCAGEAGAAICVALVDNTDDTVEAYTGVEGETIDVVGWHGDDILFSDGTGVSSVPRAGGEATRLAEIVGGEIAVAPDGATLAYPTDTGVVVVGLDGQAVATIDAPACVFAGADHLACRTATAIQLHDGASGVTELAAVHDDGAVLGAPSGDGAAFTDGGALWVAHVGSAPVRLGELRVYALDDWRP